MSSRSITILPVGRSTGLDNHGNLVILIPVFYVFEMLEADLYQLSAFSCSLLSGLRVHGTQLSSQPKVLLEEDRESGIGSTLDLSSSFEGYNQHTNHHSNTPSHREADRLPEEKGTRVT